MFEQLLLIALATFVSEDLTCIATGLLVAQGKVGFVAGTAACLAGIYIGDLLLFLAGRFAARPVLRFLSEEKIGRASNWLSERGMSFVFLSRFAPGLRLPTYIAAGLLRTKFWSFAAYFLLAAAIWTPLLVGATVLLGERILRTALSGAAVVALAFAAVLTLALLLRKLIRVGPPSLAASRHSAGLSSFNFRARRTLAGFPLRKIRWEFWRPWAACKHRSLTLFTATNPGMPSSGIIGESKSQNGRLRRSI